MVLGNSRLLLVAEMLEYADVVADIGTDHALLPVYLIKNNMAKRVLACDIAEGPLSVAKKNIIKAGVADKVLLRLANGLEKVLPLECNAVTIAGMGGETIAEIIDKAKWLKEERNRILVEAQKEAEGIVKEAENRIISMIDEHEITRKAYEQKAQIIETANEMSREISKGTKDYADNILEKVEGVLQDALKTIENNRKELK